jgi:hypothetical protein
MFLNFKGKYLLGRDEGRGAIIPLKKNLNKKRKLIPFYYCFRP